MTWYVATTQSRAEATALAAIERAGFSGYLPQQIQWKRRKWQHYRCNKVKAPLFPGYLFVDFDASREWFAPITTANGVRSVLLDQQLIPRPVPPIAIAALQRAEAAGAFDFTQRKPYKPGTAVEIQSGPLAGLIGRVRTSLGRQRIQVLVGMLAVEVDAFNLRPAEWHPTPTYGINRRI